MVEHSSLNQTPPPPIQPPWSERMANAAAARYPQAESKWCYEAGVLLKGVEQVWLKSGKACYWEYLKNNMDQFILPDGSIRTYRLDEYNIDQINQGKLLFTLFEQTGEERYRLAAELLRKQLQTHPRTREGGFWHKQIYPHQLWLDGVYMSAPFLVEFARRFDEPQAYADAVQEILLVEEHTRDERSGLLYHGWDERRQQSWADPETGRSANFWGRAIGWYMMALVDSLEFLPPEYPRRDEIHAVLQRLAPAVIKVQDQASGVWFQVLDQGARPGNYLEASASCMFAYALAKGVRLGYLPIELLKAAQRAYDGILNAFIKVDDHGLVSLTGICFGAGLGGKPYRDGSFQYYINEKVVADDHKGTGAFMFASVEMERL
ncbi:MAG: glycoside hydrolase family 88 protein [Anaerolineales bacterium]|nr:glycoside hydrolase family 88 protein [Anaerolineales bacterium]